MRTEEINVGSARWAGLEAARKALEYSGAASRAALGILSTANREEIERMLQECAQAGREISGILPQIQSEQPAQEAERGLLATVQRTHARLVGGCEAAMKAVMECEQLVEARTAATQAVLPATMDSQSSWNALVQFVEAQAELRERIEELEHEASAREGNLKRVRQELGDEMARHQMTRDRLSHLASIIESSHDAIIGISVDGKISSWNKAAETIYGFTAIEVLGQPRKILVPAGQDDEIADILEGLQRGETRLVYETVRTRKNGKRFDAAMTISPVRDSEGKLLGASAIVRDISERKQAEERFRKAFSAIPEPVTITTLQEGRYVDVNESFLRVTGHQREDVIGRTSTEVGLWERAEDRAQFADLVRRKGSLRNWEATFLTKSGTQRNAVRSAEAIELGGQECILSIFKDITDQKTLERQRREAEEELSHRAEELARSNAELEQFAYVASHDLQEPLRMVASYTELLAKRYQDKLDQDAKDFIGFAVDGATRMQALIADLLSYSRVRTRAKPFERADCEAIFQRVLRDLQVAIAESKAEVTHDPLPTVTGDPMQLAQLLQNLLTNAMKFHSEQAPKIHVWAAREGDGWQFSVRDNGIGIAQEHQERIFMIFQRLHSRGEYPGTGIGLAVCKKIVERHGGRIRVDSQAEAGATFHFTIPDRNSDEGNEKGRP